MGTSLQIIPSGNLPVAVKKNKGKLAIVNLQPTKHDKKADLKINTFVDDVLLQLCKLLNIRIPEFEKPMVLLKSVHTQSSEKELNVTIKDELLEMKLQFVNSHIKVNEEVLKLKKEKLKNSLKRKHDIGCETGDNKEDAKNGFKRKLESSDNEGGDSDSNGESIRIENVVSNYEEYFKVEKESEHKSSTEENSSTEMDEVLPCDEMANKETEEKNLTTGKSLTHEESEDSDSVEFLFELKPATGTVTVKEESSVTLNENVSVLNSQKQRVTASPGSAVENEKESEQKSSTEENSSTEMDEVLPCEEMVRKENEIKDLTTDNRITNEDSEDSDSVEILFEDKPTTGTVAVKEESSVSLNSAVKVKAPQNIGDGSEMDNATADARGDSPKAKERVSDNAQGHSSSIVCYENVGSSGDSYTSISRSSSSHDYSDFIELDSDYESDTSKLLASGDCIS